MNLRYRGPTSFLFSLTAIAVACVAPAQATTYNFAIPVSVVKQALFNGVSFAGGNTNLYAFYDVYVRPAVNGIGGDSILSTVANNLGGQIVGNSSSYTITDFASPIPSGPDQVAVNLSTIAPSDGGKSNVEYKYKSTDTVEPLITNNANVSTQSYDNNGSAVPMRGEVMPAGDIMFISINSANLLGGPVRFEVRGFAYQFADAQALSSGLVTKTQTFSGYFDAQGTATPEPGVLFTMSAGLGLLALVGARRRRSAETRL